ncbi:MAG TPA: uroporphyrinogen decarboxylase family protein [Candidatus Sulfotelmatobacter sp.]|nr:uroporphyrinogen decarboxylase family protein [Candidatus Sulfotelmatobacter sp.]
MSLSHRDRVLTVLNHEKPDRVAMDLGGSPGSGINLYAYKRLTEHLGLRGPVRVQSERSLLAWPDEAVLERFGADLRLIVARAPEDSGNRGTFDEAAYEQDAEYTDVWGVVRRRPPRGHYYVVRAPFDRDDLSPADLDAHPWPAPRCPDADGLHREAERLRRETDCALVAFVPGRIFSMGQFLCGFSNWLVQLKVNREFCEALLDRTLDIQLGMAAETLKALDGAADILYLADDYGIQTGPLIAPALFREVFKPRMARLIAFLKARSSAKIAFHSCGSVSALIPDFIEVGVDILNPLQVAAADMDTARLHREFGRRLIFWGGIDTQRVLPAGTAAEVRAEVARRVRDLWPGYIAASVHNIQAEVPAGNIVAMFDALQGAPPA